MTTAPTPVEYDGRPILGQSVKITNAGDGLSTALAVDPRDFHLGERVYVVLETEVAAAGFVPVKDTDGVRQVNTLRAGDATIVDAALVEAVLDAQRVRIEEAQGVSRLPLDDPEPDPTAEPPAEDVAEIGSRKRGRR